MSGNDLGMAPQKKDDKSGKRGSGMEQIILTKISDTSSCHISAQYGYSL